MSDAEYLQAMEIQRRNFEAQFGTLEAMGFDDQTQVTDSSSEEDEEEAELALENEEVLEDEEEASQPQSKRTKRAVRDEDLEDNHSEFDSEMELLEAHAEATPAPVVVKFSEASSFDFQPVMSKQEQKLARMGKIPTLEMARMKADYLAQKAAKFQTQTKSKEELENVENDMALQRLLSESHILANNTPQYSGAELTMQTIDYDEPIGKARKRTLDSRMQKVAAINGKNEGVRSTLEKMPMHMRKGMVSSQIRKIGKFEQEAKDGGIILSKVKKGEFRDLKKGMGSTSVMERIGTGVKTTQKVRDRGLKINTVGRSTRNGIVISKEEISRYNAPERGRGKSGRGGRGGSSRGGGSRGGSARGEGRGGSSRGGSSRGGTGFPTPGGRGGRR